MKMKSFQKEEKKIVIVICFYGSFPWYFDFFIHSCGYNPTVDFMIVTDNSYNQTLPENVKIVHLTLEKLTKTISQRLGFEVHIEFPYKLADFKPAYGFIFPELIRGYDFWGHGDIDVIFGNIRNFITGKMLNDYDLISIRHDIISGFFMIFRNNPKMNRLFMRSRNYKKALSSAKYYNFDECNFAFGDFQLGIPPEDIKSEIESMNHLVKKLHHIKKIKAHFDFLVIEGKPGQLKWEKGIMTFRNKFEVMLYHLIRFKRTCEVPKMRKIPDRFYISPTQIYAQKISGLDVSATLD